MNKTINPFVYQRILESRMPNSTIPSWLNESYAQVYEDVIIESIFRAYAKRKGKPINGIKYIEIGANHPVATSSTILWQRKYGITGILVEANPELVKVLEKFRPHDKVVHAAACVSKEKEIEFYISPSNELSSLSKEFQEHVKFCDGIDIEKVVKVPTVRVNDLLAMTSDMELTILIIDVEGLDLDLLQDINFNKYKPYIIEVEPSDGFAPGTSDKMISFLKTKKYSLVGETDVNLIFKLDEKI